MATMTDNFHCKHRKQFSEFLSQLSWLAGMFRRCVEGKCRRSSTRIGACPPNAPTMQMRWKTLQLRSQIELFERMVLLGEPQIRMLSNSCRRRRSNRVGKWWIRTSDERFVGFETSTANSPITSQLPKWWRREWPGRRWKWGSQTHANRCRNCQWTQRKWWPAPPTPTALREWSRTDWLLFGNRRQSSAATTQDGGNLLVWFDWPLTQMKRNWRSLSKNRRVKHKQEQQQQKVELIDWEFIDVCRYEIHSMNITVNNDCPIANVNFLDDVLNSANMMTVKPVFLHLDWHNLTAFTFFCFFTRSPIFKIWISWKLWNLDLNGGDRLDFKQRIRQ